MVLGKILRLGEGKTFRRCAAVVPLVAALEEEMQARSDAELRALTDAYRERAAGGESLDDLLPEAFATVREAGRRVLGKRHFDVQLIGGAALHFGYVAEMRTGEGKTLTATLPCYLNALAGRGVHVVTVNDYLARRDAEWMGAVHRFLGMTVGTILAPMSPWERRAAYECDITYGTNNELGFDYLRDNMAMSPDELVQRGHAYACVDEVDSILIDEARTPLIISGPAEQGAQAYEQFAQLVPKLERDVHYDVDEAKQTIAVTEEGVTEVERLLGIENLYDALNTPLIHHLQNAIRAKELYKRDVDYLIREGEVMIVDEFTGRVLEGRRYSEGLHQAIEAKEGVRIREENQTYASITLQNYFRLYEKLSGMTGTAKTEEAELAQIYSLGVIEIPTNRSMVRIDHGDLVYKGEDAKFLAVVEEIAERYEVGQPVLVGTVSIEKSERLAHLLRERGIVHQVLNAKQHDREAHIIAQAGRLKGVTVATNMAGRGVDIMLGGNVEYLAEDALRARGVDPLATEPEVYGQALQAEIEEVTARVAEEHQRVVDLGGLCVIGTERHESRRVDNQLRGRAGRQGDPGASLFFLSLEDDLMRRFATRAVSGLMDRLNLPEDVPITHKLVTRAISNAQRQVESQNFEMRKNVLKYDEVLNTQREVIYEVRRRILEGQDLRAQTLAYLHDVVAFTVARHAPEGTYPEDWDMPAMLTALGAVYPVQIQAENLQLEELDRARLTELVVADAEAVYAAREAQLTPEILEELERVVLLTVLDRHWREHLYEMQYLQDGIGLRAIGQRDPLVEYRREGYQMFHAMQDTIKGEALSYVFNASVEVAVQLDEQQQGGMSAPISPLGVDEAQIQDAIIAPIGTPSVALSAGAGGHPAAGPVPSPMAAPPPLPGSLPGRLAGGMFADVAGDGSGGAFSSAAGPNANTAPPGRDGGGSGQDAKLGRNDPCSCGSGKKYKNCHGSARAW